MSFWTDLKRHHKMAEYNSDATLMEDSENIASETDVASEKPGLSPNQAFSIVTYLRQLLVGD
jgi:hypothetical protein